MSKVIAFVSIKGGVGKTTLALEIAAALANIFDKKVLVIDANFSAPNVGLYLDLTSSYHLQDALKGTRLQNAIYEAHGFDVVPAEMDYKGNVPIEGLKELVKKHRNRYDFIIIDSSPHYEELRPVITAADEIFLVTSPDRVTLTTTLRAGNLAREQFTPIEGIIVNKVRSPKHEYNVKEVEAISKIPVMARIRDHRQMARSLNEKTPLIILDSGNPISKEIEGLASALCGLPEKKSFFEKFLSGESWMGKEKVNRQLLKEKFYESKL